MAKKAIPVAPENLGRSESTRGTLRDGVSISLTKCSGNKCAHNPLSPEPFISDYIRPWLIQKMQKALFRYYFQPLRYLGITARSERREAIMRVGQCIIDYLDLTTLKVKYLNIHRIFKYTNLGYKRVLRALKDLKEAGFIFVQRQYEHKGDKFFGKDSIRTVSLKFLKALGIEFKALLKHRNKKDSQFEPKDVEDSFNRSYEARMKEYQVMPSNTTVNPFKAITELITKFKV